MIVKPIEPARKWGRDASTAIKYAKEASAFIDKHKLWRGLAHYSWLLKGIVIIAALAGLRTISFITDLFSGDANVGQNSLMASFDNFSLESITGFFDGVMKYVILAAVEVIIFHFTRRTMMIITERPIDTSWNTFLKAEKRMIAVTFVAFGLEKAFGLGWSIFSGIFGFDFFEPVFMALVQSFYLGFAIIDNYNELYDMSIKQSHRFTWHYMPVALIVGGMLNVMLHVPLLGVLIGPIICAVVATLTMHYLNKEDKGVAWVFVEKKKKKKPTRKANGKV